MTRLQGFTAGLGVLVVCIVIGVVLGLAFGGRAA